MNLIFKNRYLYKVIIKNKSEVYIIENLEINILWIYLKIN